MKADEVSKEAAAASDANKPVEKSPHAKEVSFLLFSRQPYHLLFFFQRFPSIFPTFSKLSAVLRC